MSASLADKQSAARIRYNKIIFNCQLKRLNVNVNVIRDLVATDLKRKGLFRTYDAALKFATDYVASHYDQGNASYAQMSIL